MKCIRWPRQCKERDIQGTGRPCGLELRDFAEGVNGKPKGKRRFDWGGAWILAKEGFIKKKKKNQSSPSLTNQQVCLLNMDS